MLNTTLGHDLEVPMLSKLQQCRQEQLQGGLAADAKPDVDPLYFELAILLDRCQKYLDAHREQHIDRLRAERDELYAKCRAAENEFIQNNDSAAQLNAQLNGSGQQIARLRQQLDDVQPDHRTAFPTDEETEAFEAKKRPFQNALGQEQFRQREFQDAHLGALNLQETARRTLNELRAQLKEINQRIQAAEREQ